MTGMTSTMNLPMILRSPRSDDVLRVNRPFEEQLGLGGQELGARPFLDWIHPEDRKALEQAVEAGTGRATARHATRAGEWALFDWQLKTHGDDLVALGLLLEEARQHAATSSEGAPHAWRTLSKTLTDMALIVEARNPGLKCSILLMDAAHECVTVGAGPSLPAEYNAAVEGLRIGPTVGSCGTASFWNVPVIVESIADDPLWASLRGVAELAGLAACWSHPITGTDGSVLGAMALYAEKASAPTQRQMDALELSSHMVALAVERERLEEQLRLAAKMQALGVLAGGIAHDFNNMLTAIQGSAELGLLALTEGGEAGPLMQNIITACDGATGLCSQMLAYAGQNTLSSEVLDLNALVEELGGLLQVALSKKATLSLELMGDSLGVLGDRSQLRQVVMNLITNAADAIGNHEGSIVLRTQARMLRLEEQGARLEAADLDAGEYVVLRVSDTGDGMDAETQARIFDPFFTTKSAGHGLGLAAVQGIVRAHGGTISLESTRGVGTTFTVMLPRVPAGDTPPAGQAAAPSAVEGACVLVVDDDDGVRKILARMLSRAGYTVLAAADGQQAVDVFRERKDTIDCVLLDLSMPKRDGEEVFHELRAIQPGVRVVLNSGYMAREIRNRLKGAGFAGFLQKPPSMRALLAKVAEVIAESPPLRSPS
jgi:signal transduction histidine kinase/CheY-like chemotaxis protein